MLPPLLPEPKRATAKPGAFRLRSAQPIVLPEGADDADFDCARALRDALAARSSAVLAVETHARAEDLGPRIELSRGEAGEGYRLEVTPERVALHGDGAAGLRYGIETLVQLADARGRVPACVIEDAPALPLRGLMLDVSRGKVPTLDTLFWLVRLCARLKLNLLMLYTEHTFAFRRHPEIGAGASPYDAEEMRALDAFAAAHHVQLVPTLQTLGHMERLLSLRRYRGLDESGRGWTLSPEDPGTAALLRDLLDEYLPNFRSGFFNANCDEPYDLGRGRSRERAESIGRGRVFLDHVRSVRDLARSHGKRTMIWADVVHQHPELVDEIDRDLVMLDWWYEAQCDYERVRVFRERGLEFLVCPGTSSWNCLFPRVANSLANIAGWADAARRFGGHGLVCTDWGDFGHYNLHGASLLAFAFAAQQAWSGETPPARFDRAFGRALFGDASGLAARLWRQLGSVHDAGFPVFNGSGFQYLFFDDLERGVFVQASRDAALRRAAAKLAKLRPRIARAARAFGDDALSHAEMLWAADATHFAAEKGLTGRVWLAWRRDPDSLDARGRRKLAQRLGELASAQQRLGRDLAGLWRLRARPSNLAFTRRRIRRSVESLRRAARAVQSNAPPPAPEPLAKLDPSSVAATVRAGAPAPSPAHPVR